MRENRSNAPKDTWFQGCGWLWGAESGTARICESLVQRKLVQVFARHVKRGAVTAWTRIEYRLTKAGKELADKLIEARDRGN